MIRAAVIAVLMLTAAVTGAVAFDHYRPAKVVSAAATTAEPAIVTHQPSKHDAPHKSAKHRDPRKIHIHKPLHILGKRYPGDDSANELNLRELRR